MGAMEEPVKENFFQEFFKKRCELAYSSGQSQVRNCHNTTQIYWINSLWRGQSQTRKKLNSQLELLAQQRETVALKEANAFDAFDQESQLSRSLLPNTEHVDP